MPTNQNPMFRPHVRDLNQQQKAQQEKESNAGLFGTLVMLAAGGMAMYAGGAHAVKGIANSARTANSASPNIGATSKFRAPEIDTKAVRNGAKRFGRNAFEHGDEFAEMLENNRKEDDEKDAQAIAMAKAKESQNG